MLLFTVLLFTRQHRRHYFIYLYTQIHEYLPAASWCPAHGWMIAGFCSRSLQKTVEGLEGMVRGMADTSKHFLGAEAEDPEVRHHLCMLASRFD